jgi:hypothetical protein
MRSLATAALFLCATGCALNQEYVKADRLTYEAVAPAYLKYLDADPALDQEQKDRRKRTVETWKLRISKAEEE